MGRLTPDERSADLAIRPALNPQSQRFRANAQIRQDELGGNWTDGPGSAPGSRNMMRGIGDRSRTKGDDDGAADRSARSVPVHRRGGGTAPPSDSSSSACRRTGPLRWMPGFGRAMLVTLLFSSGPSRTEAMLLTGLKTAGTGSSARGSAKAPGPQGTAHEPTRPQIHRCRCHVAVRHGLRGLRHVTAEAEAIRTASGPVQAVIYAVLGLAWILPLMPLIAWMERPDREPGL